MMTLRMNISGAFAPDFDNKKVKPIMRKVAQGLAKAAKSNVGKAGYAGKRTGALRSGIKGYTSKSGFTAFARQRMPKGSGEFYPSFLLYGVTGQKRRKDRQAQVKTGRWRIKPRKDHVHAAMAANRSAIQTHLSHELKQCLRFL
jgi:hypothetical protein